MRGRIERRFGRAVSIIRRALAALLIASVAGGLPAPCLGAVQERVDALRALYDQHLTRIQDEYTQAVQAWPQSYSRSLNALRRAMQTAGRLEGWTAVNAEVDRFRDCSELPEEAVVSGPAELRSLQLRTRAALAGFAIRRSRAVLSLTEKYLARLKAEEKDLTVRGRIEDALVFHEEIERVKSSPAVTSAAFEVADHKVRTAAAGAAAEEETVPEPPAAGPEDAPRPHATGGGFTSDGVRIHAAGRRPPRIGGLVRSPLHPTAHSPLRNEVSVKVQIGKDSTRSSDSTSTDYSFSSSTRHSTESAVRLTVRGTRVENELADLAVVVQYFAREVGGPASRIEPIEQAVRFAHLPVLDVREVFVDLPPVTTSRSSRDYRSFGYRSSSDRGRQFYGLIVSVFKDDNSLAYQGATAHHLLSYASRAKPETREVKRKIYEEARRRYDEARDAYFREMTDEGLRSAYEDARKAYDRARDEYDRHDGD